MTKECGCWESCRKAVGVPLGQILTAEQSRVYKACWDDCEDRCHGLGEYESGVLSLADWALVKIGAVAARWNRWKVGE